MPGIQGPELIERDGTLHTPAATTDLERAAEALDTMTSAVQELMASLKKDEGGEPAPTSEPTDETEKAGNPAVVLREVAERAMAASKACEGGQVDPAVLADEVKALGQLLKGLIEKPAEPKAEGAASEPAPPPAEEQKNADGAKTNPMAEGLRKSADAAMGLLARVQAENAQVDDELGTAVRALATELQAIAQAATVEKASGIVLPEVFTMESPETAQLVAGLVKSLRETTERLATLAKMADAGIVTDSVKKELSEVLAITGGIAEALPTQTAKASKLFSATLRDVAERALTLSRKASDAGFNEARGLREIGNIQKLLESVSVKYAQKSGELDISDLSAVLGADRMLNEFEEQLVKSGLLKKSEPVKPVEQAVAPAVVPVVTEPPKPETAAVVTAPSAPAPITEPAKPVEPIVAAAPVATVAPAVTEPGTPAPAVTEPGPSVPELLAKMADMTKQISDLRALVAKARGTVPAPSAGGADPQPIRNDEALLFPFNYNSPAYREALDKKRGAPRE